MDDHLPRRRRPAGAGANVAGTRGPADVLLPGAGAAPVAGSVDGSVRVVEVETVGAVVAAEPRRAYHASFTLLPPGG